MTKAPEAQAPQIPSAAEKEKPEPAPATPPAAAEPSSDFELLAQRANEGDVHAQMDLAEAYLKGDEVPADRAKAASWYIMAGENGSAEAKSRSIAVTHGMSSPQIGEIRFDVGKMFMQGIGRERDDVSAYKWFELAKAAGDIRAESQEAALEQKMSESELVKARNQASDWLKSHSGKSKKQR
ncbi:MAG: sel1 repeat family protein [Acidobacteria bacterium]|nr:sel1 repeat family protein [Acidobacteriota bacterium]